MHHKAVVSSLQPCLVKTLKHEICSIIFFAFIIILNWKSTFSFFSSMKTLKCNKFPYFLVKLNLKICICKDFLIKFRYLKLKILPEMLVTEFLAFVETTITQPLQSTPDTIAQFLSRLDYSNGGVIRTLPPEFVGSSRRGHCV
jgi:hypothetical protein